MYTQNNASKEKIGELESVNYLVSLELSEQGGDKKSLIAMFKERVVPPPEGVCAFTPFVGISKCGLLYAFAGTFNAEGILADKVKLDKEEAAAEEIRDWHKKGNCAPGCFLLKHVGLMTTVTKTDQRIRHSHLFEGLIVTFQEGKLRERCELIFKISSRKCDN
jgi:hypothetical protein